jgi:hypothetical protein
MLSMLCSLDWGSDVRYTFPTDTVPTAGRERKHNACRVEVGGCVSGCTHINRVLLCCQQMVKDQFAVNYAVDTLLSVKLSLTVTETSAACLACALMARECHTCSETFGPRMPKRRSDNSKRSFSWLQGGYAFKCPKTLAFLANWFAKLKYLWVSWYLSDILTWRWRLEGLNSLRSSQFKLLSLYHTFLSAVGHLLPCTLLSA